MKPTYDPKVAVCPDEQVIATAFYSLQTMEGSKAKPTFVNKAAIFSKFESVYEIVKWAEKELTEQKDRLLKIEVTQNSR
jgi:hypothetical protein